MCFKVTYFLLGPAPFAHQYLNIDCSFGLRQQGPGDTVLETTIITTGDVKYIIMAAHTKYM